MVFMFSCTRLATLFVAALAALSLSTTFAFGAIFPLTFSSRRINNKMGSAHSSQSSLQDGTASIEDRDRSVSAKSAANDESKKSGVQLVSATTNDSIDDSLHKSHRSMLSLQQQHTYTPPSTPIKPLAHYIFLVHGWLGNDLEMGYLSKSFRDIISPCSLTDAGDEDCGDSAGAPDAKRVRRSSSYQSRLLTKQMQKESSGDLHESEEPEIVVHSVKCNVGKTHDGIKNGGTRLANEITDFIKSDVAKRLADKGGNENNNEGESENNENHVTYSLIGNSLGGLYSRYAVSLLPYQLELQNGNSMLNLHPNIFCTTATPHLGVSRHTYLPIPRIAETIIGTGMGMTGRDLFRLNSEKDLASHAAGNIMNAAARRLSALRPQQNTGDDTSNINGGSISNVPDEEEYECVIHKMCLQDKFLAPLRNFRQRIAYANAYGTDFQVPTQTAAFLHEKSGVGHFVIASRDTPQADAMGDTAAKEENKASTTDGDTVMEDSAESKMANGDTAGGEQEEEVPPFIVAVVRTEKQSQPQSPTKSTGDANKALSDELLRMSQSLDALGWTKVFIDVRDRIPVRALAKPVWMRRPCGSLDDLIRERVGLSFTSLQPTDTNDETATSNNDDAADSAARSRPPKVQTEQCILTSQELAQSTSAGDSINFPLGHTVMIANSKNERYTQLNSQGRPVMDRLAEDMVNDVLDFE